MRLKRLMSIVLAVALVLSFAMSASAGKLYFELDFADYANNMTALADSELLEDAAANTISGSGTLNVATWRESGKSIVFTAGAGQFTNATHAPVTQDAAGNYLFGFGESNMWNEKFMTFLTSESWDAVARAGKTLVMSVNVDSRIGDYYNYIGLVGNKGTADAPSYGSARIITSPNYSLMAATTGVTTGDRLGIANGDGVTKRLAYGVTYNAADDRLAKVAAVDGVKKSTSDVGLDLNGMKSVEGFGFGHHATHPVRQRSRIGNILIYEIDTTEGFKVTAPIDGEKRLSLDTTSTTITFTHPVAPATLGSAVYTITKDGVEIAGGLTAGAIETKVVDGNYVSTVDVTLPTLEMSGNYEITVSGVTNELGTALADNKISFSTPLPDITTGTPVIDSMAIGSMNNASVTISNNTVSTDKKVAVIYAVYTEAGKLVDVVYADDTIAADSTATISAGITLGSDAYKAKVMVWDGITTVSPFRGFADATVQ